MRHHLRSTAVSSPGRLPAPSEGAGDEDDEESVRAVAVSDQRTIYLVNMFIANTVEFLNSFAATCDDKLALLHRKIVKLDSSLALLEAKLHSIDENNALGHSTSLREQQSSSDDKIFCSENLVGESSRKHEKSQSQTCSAKVWEMTVRHDVRFSLHHIRVRTNEYP